MSVRSSGRASGSSKRSVHADVEYEAKAAYLVIEEDINTPLTSLTQLRNALAHCGRNLPRKKLSKYWNDDTESISFEEFVKICENEPATTEDDLLKAFKKIDINGDGFITNDELRKTLTTKGERMTVEEVQDIIDEVDENKDGKLNYQEFCKMLLGTQEEAKKLAVARMEKRSRKPRSSKRSKKSSEVTQLISEAEDKIEEVTGTDEKETPVEEEKEESNAEDIQEEVKDGSESEQKENETETPKTQDENEPSPGKAEQIIVEAEVHEEVISDKEIETESPPVPQPRSRQSEKDVSSAEDSGKDEDEVDSDDDSDDDIVIGSQVSLQKKSESKPTPQPRRRGGSKIEEINEEEEEGSRSGASEKIRNQTRNAITSRRLKLNQPSNISEWEKVSSGGCFFFDGETGEINGHQYELKIQEDTSVWMTVSQKPTTDGIPSVDTLVLVLREDDSIVTFSEQRDRRGKFGLRCDLDKGTYKVIPFTTGCKFKRRKNEPPIETKLVRKKGDKYMLTRPFRDALGEIFRLCDLDGDGLLNRKEFSLFNLRTSGEAVADEEWEVVEENVDMQDGKITEQGFIDLNQMEADDNEGDTEDLWVTLACMGFNKGLVMDEACPYVLDVYTEDGNPELTITTLDSIDDIVNSSMTDATKQKGACSKIKHMRDLNLHLYITDFLAMYAVENKSHSRVTVSLDCSRSVNCLSNHGSLEHSLEIAKGGSKLVHFLMPADESKDWTVRCIESVIK